MGRPARKGGRAPAAVPAGPARTSWAIIGAAKACASGRITRFDASPFRTQIAAEIDDFDPLNYVDRKLARRLSRFG
ncbi:MAG TPA: hypothetical protein VII06_24850 [Chloroflexota bacterium]|jgi:3-oxoacyl-[acyl-carrier-protein] synthase II